MRNEMASIKIYEKWDGINQSLSNKVSSSTTFRCPVDWWFEKTMRLRVFVLKTKFITSDKTLIRRLWGIVLYNVVNSKGEILWGFFLVFILVNFVKIENEISKLHQTEA